jgi:hypothetical protein
MKVDLIKLNTKVIELVSSARDFKNRIKKQLTFMKFLFYFF